MVKLCTHLVQVSQNVFIDNQQIMMHHNLLLVNNNILMIMFLIVDTPAQFSISRGTGLITVDPNNPLDYETNTTYSFIVEATDMGSVPCTVSTNTI